MELSFIYWGASGMPRSEKKEKGSTKASVYMDPEEYRSYKHEAVDRNEKISRYLLGLIRLGKEKLERFKPFIAAAKAFIGEYDWADVHTIFEGGEPDRDWMKRDVKSLRDKAGSPKGYQELLLERKEANSEARRFCEIQDEVLDEELEEVEHLLEK
jgi:hypothetical protein